MLKLLRLHGWAGFLHLLYSKINTVIFFPGVRLMSIPFDIRNKRNIDFGKRLHCGKYCRLEVYPRPGHENEKILVIGNDVEINDSVHITAVEKVTIGNNVLMASKIFISDSNHGDYKGAKQSHPDEPPSARRLSSSPIVIEDNVWLGEFVTVLQGVTIGRGSIIGSMSVVSKDIPPYSIAVGSPTRIIKKYNFESKRWENL